MSANTKSPTTANKSTGHRQFVINKSINNFQSTTMDLILQFGFYQSICPAPAIAAAYQLAGFWQSNNKLAGYLIPPRLLLTNLGHLGYFSTANCFYANFRQATATPATTGSGCPFYSICRRARQPALPFQPAAHWPLYSPDYALASI